MKYNNYLVSVIIPTKGERNNMLYRCLRSVGDQQQFCGEVIVVLDNNISYLDDIRKNIINISQLYSNWVFRVIHTNNDKSNGVSFARNYGASIAKGEFLCFLDDDDVWKPKYLKTAFENDEFDVALTSFEKHTLEKVYPEKVPPATLRANKFYVKNPGIRGSNLIIRGKTFFRIGGFDENLLAFNDMDIGIRISQLEGIRYKRISEHLVEFHRHESARISSPGCKENVQGLIGFVSKYGNDMGYFNEALFRERAIKLWNIDPWDLNHIKERITQSLKKNNLKFDFSNILHALETRFLEVQHINEYERNQIQELIDNLCHLYEFIDDRPLAPTISIATTVTNSAQSLKNLVTSLQEELNASKWNLNDIETKPINIYVVENSNIDFIKKNNLDFIKKWSDPRINIILIESQYDQQSIVSSRRYLCRKINEMNLDVSPQEPLWMLDDDLQFISMIACEKGWKKTRFGSILHRLECIIKCTDADAIVCGNTYCPPVLPLVSIKVQLNDIISQYFEKNSISLNWVDTISFMNSYKDCYYDLSRESVPVKVIPLISRWWNEDYTKVTNMNDSLLSEILYRLCSGLPVTRPLFTQNMSNPSTAWWNDIDVTVSGGNTVIISKILVDEKLYWVIDNNGTFSRRGDTCWSMNSSKNGANICRYHIPLYHQRENRSSLDVSLKEYWTKGLIMDNLGVGLYESLLHSPSEQEKPSQVMLNYYIIKRQQKVNKHLLSVKKRIAYLRSKISIEEYPKSVQILEKILAYLPDQIHVDFDNIKISIPYENITNELENKLAKPLSGERE